MNRDKNVGVFTFDSRNLGDEMQSFAVLAHLDRVQTFVDRDRLPEFAAERNTACVFNSWFLQGDDFRRPSDRIDPVWHGFAAGRPQVTSGEWLAYLREQPRVGCRDLFTTRLLQEAGIDAHWSGCLTLFLGAALTVPARDRRGVVFVDVPPAAERVIPRALVERAERLSTFPGEEIIGKPLERWAALARLAARLAEAELVVTRRLHVALPAASFGTPVVVFADGAISQARRRFSGYDAVLPVVLLEELETRGREIDWTNVPLAAIPREVTDSYAAFTDTLRLYGLSGSKRVETALDDVRRHEQRLTNVGGKPQRVSLRLNDRRFELETRGWTSHYVDVRLSGFPGLSKFDFHVEAQQDATGPWLPWGSLRELVVDDPARPRQQAPAFRSGVQANFTRP